MKILIFHVWYKDWTVKMLVLSRKTGQKIIINDNIEITIIETKGDFVRIGIEAPKNVSIYREEIYDEIKQANTLSQANQNDIMSTIDILKTTNVWQNKDIKSKFNIPLAKPHPKKK